jgi:hypothetical protein
MWHQGLRRGLYEDPNLLATPFWPMSEGEVHYFYWFIQGSIMNVDTRRALHRGWGFCERHAWGGLAVEMCFRTVLLLGPTILYEDLLHRSLDAFPRFGPLKTRRLALRLRPRGPCIMCDMKAHDSGPGVMYRSLIEEGQGTDRLRDFALRHRPYWEPAICGLCRGDGAEIRCRRHLIERADQIDRSSLERHRGMLATTHRHVQAFGRSFVWGQRGTDGPEDRAALLAAIGWMSGWRPLLELVDAHDEAAARRTNLVRMPSRSAS